MYSIKANIIALSLMAVSSYGYAAVDCAPVTTNHKQCSFDIPAVKDGQAAVFENNNKTLFSGATAVVCRNGKLTVGKTSCGPTSPSNCSVDESQWFGDNEAVCSHDYQSQIIKDGGEMRVNSISGIGYVSYQCDDGSLKVKNMSCGKQFREEEATKINKAAVLQTQSLTVTKDYDFKLNFESSYYTSSTSSRVTAQAVAKCMEIDGFTDSSSVTYNYTGTSGGNYQYTATCPMSISNLRCDQEVVSASVLGSYNSKEGEFTNDPDGVRVMTACSNRGFKHTYRDLRYMGLDYPGILDDFRVIMTCSGKDSQCDDVKPPLGTPYIVSPSSCYDSTVRSGLLEVSSGSSVSTAKVLDEVCEPLGFTGLKSMTTPILEDQTGAFDYYRVTASCTGYQYTSTEPLMASCGTTAPTNGAAVVDFIDCDSANVTGLLSGDRNPVTWENNIPPSNNSISTSLCNANNFTTLDSVVGSVKSGADDTMYEVTARCSGYNGPERSECATDTECFGRVLPNNTQEPYLQVDGVKYFNKCYSKTTNPDDLCLDCAASSFSFTDPVTKNTCSVNVSTLISGESTNVPFFDSGTHGEVDIKCNNGEKSVDGASTCYKTCTGGVTLGWNDVRGNQSCGQTVPAGNYRHEQRVSFSSSTRNTGSAVYQCNGYTGGWEIVSGTCTLDCSGSESWGSGTSRGGTNKTNACSSPLPTVKHGATGTVTSTASLTSGQASYTCNDGNFELSNQSCNLGCNSQRGQWGDANRCQVNLNSQNHGSSGVYNNDTSLVQGFNYYQDINGTARLTCNDGRIDVSNESCAYVTGLRYSGWSSWRWVSPAENRNCTAWSPSASSVNEGQTFTARRTCEHRQISTQNVYKEWSDGRSDTFTRTDTKYQWVSVEASEQRVGTRRYLISQGWGDWSNWSGWSYGSTTCSSTNLYPGVDRQTCTRPKTKTRTRRYIYTYSSSPVTVYGSSQTDTYNGGSDTVSTKCHATGNTRATLPCQPIDTGPTCYSGSSNRVEREFEEVSDYGDNETVVEDVKYIRNGSVVYHYSYSRDRDGKVTSKTTGSTAGYSSGKNLESEHKNYPNGGFFEWDVWEICVD